MIGRNVRGLHWRLYPDLDFCLDEKKIDEKDDEKIVGMPSIEQNFNEVVLNSSV